MVKRIALAITSLVAIASVAEACPTGLRPFNKKLNGKDACVLEGTYKGGELTLSSSFNYILLGPVFIGSEVRNKNLELEAPIEGAKLTINAGVEIYALNPAKDKTGVWSGFKDANGNPVEGDIKTFLSVTRDSQIIVDGNSGAPVLMSSAQGMHQEVPSFEKRPGDWGGLVISGKAKSNKCTEFADCTLPGEADTGFYGGDMDTHSSGSLKYLQVEYGGDRIDDEKELNGITFNAVGLGTIISNIAVLYNSDDCIEFFGGAVRAKNVFCYKGEDDGIDTTDGARIFLQNGVVVAGDYPEAGEDNDRHMVEADSSKSDANNQKLRSHPVLVNFTFVGGINSQGLKLRRGTDYTLVNSVMIGVDKWCMDPSGSNELIFGTNVFADCASSDPVSSMAGSELVSGSSLKMDQWIPSSSSPLLKGAELMEEFFPEDLDLDDAFLNAYEEVEYRGAVGSDDWTSWIQTRD